MTRLGSPSDEHARSRDRAYDRAAVAIGAAERALRAGHCQGAFRSLTEAAGLAAEFRVHAREAGGGAAQPLDVAVQSLAASFGVRCVRDQVVPSSGTIGRARRRRR